MGFSGFGMYRLWRPLIYYKLCSLSQWLNKMSLFLPGKKARTFDLEAIFEQTRRTAIERSQHVLGRLAFSPVICWGVVLSREVPDCQKCSSQRSVREPLNRKSKVKAPHLSSPQFPLRKKPLQPRPSSNLMFNYLSKCDVPVLVFQLKSC